LKGTIFDIQRFSVHDGPGIRTTVFMKGCPLRCRWCHNPEGFLPDIQLRFFEEKCIGCGRCNTRTKFSDADKCPTGALEICGKEVDEKEIIDEVLKDRIFYGDNGGVTFSGGECLCQADFVSSVLSMLKPLGLHTAIDTSGYVSWEAIEKTLDLCDLYLYDVKCIDAVLHKKHTGVDNSLILQNLKRLTLTGKDIWIRIPVIPGFNNSEKEITAIANFISSYECIRQVTLMPYHTLGASKYKTLGLEYIYDASQKITSDEINLFTKIFSDRKIILK